MDDREIVKLFWARSPQAVDALDEAYGPDLRRLAQRLLDDRQDAEECVNDTYLSLWQGIPPAKPDPLLPYALRVTRNLCLKRKRWNTAGKRSSPFDAAFEELEDCLGNTAGPEASFDEGERLSITENNGAVRLSRLREKLKAHLRKKGVLE